MSSPRLSVSESKPRGGIVRNRIEGEKAMFFGAQGDEATRRLTAPVTVKEVGVYRGPHYWSLTPMVRIQVDLGRLEDWPTDRLPGFADALLERLPGLDR